MSTENRQRWPLVGKVTIYGPWEILMFGCCLIDLPGTNDNVSSRAEVAEQHIKTCDRIWVVSDIKRAVNDGVAKDLLGQQVRIPSILRDCFMVVMSKRFFFFVIENSLTWIYL